jgi:type IV pilus assembly protein PilM
MTPVVGLDLGTSAVRAAQLTAGRRNAFTLDRIGQVPLPPGAIRDGEIADIDTVAQALRLLWQNFKFKSRKVALGLANQQVVVRQVDLPYLPEAELRQSLSFQAQDYIPIPLEQAILDVHILENLELEGGQRISRVLLVAAQQAMVGEFVAVARKANLEPVGLDLNPFAVLRALADDRLLAEREGELLIDVGAAVTNLVIHCGGAPRFVRILPVGGLAITDALMDSLGLSFEEAEQVKATIGIPDDYLVALTDDQARLIAEGASRLVEEIRGSVDYYTGQEEAVPVCRGVLTGGAGLLPNLRERLEDALGVKVDYGRPLERLRVGKVGLGREDLAQAEAFFTVAVGLAMGAAT